MKKQFEILDEFLQGESSLDDGQYHQIKLAMDKYASQQAIAFANHVAFNHSPIDIDLWDNGKKNTTELYDEFINLSKINS